MHDIFFFNIFISIFVIFIPLIVTLINIQRQKNAKKLDDAIKKNGKTRQREFKYTMIDSQEDYLFKNSADEVQYYSEEEDFAEEEYMLSSYNSSNKSSTVLSEKIKKTANQSIGKSNISKQSKAHSLRRAIILSEILGKPKSMN